MERERTPQEDAVRDLGVIVLRSGATLAVGAVATLILLFAPLVVWAQYGDAFPLRSAAVAIASLLLCGVVLRATMRRYAALWHKEPLRLQAISTPASCKPNEPHRAATPRDRRDPSSRPCGPSRCRPRYTARGPRDAGCSTATPLLGRRSSRRRTRP